MNTVASLATLDVTLEGDTMPIVRRDDLRTLVIALRRLSLHLNACNAAGNRARRSYEHPTLARVLTWNLTDTGA